MSMQPDHLFEMAEVARLLTRAALVEVQRQLNTLITILSLPQELHEEIGSYLKAADVANLRLTCKVMANNLMRIQLRYIRLVGLQADVARAFSQLVLKQQEGLRHGSLLPIGKVIQEATIHIMMPSIHGPSRDRSWKFALNRWEGSSSSSQPFSPLLCQALRAMTPIRYLELLLRTVGANDIYDLGTDLPTLPQEAALGRVSLLRATGICPCSPEIFQKFTGLTGLHLDVGARSASFRAAAALFPGLTRLVLCTNSQRCFSLARVAEKVARGLKQLEWLHIDDGAKYSHFSRPVPINPGSPSPNLHDILHDELERFAQALRRLTRLRRVAFTMNSVTMRFYWDVQILATRSAVEQSYIGVIEGLGTKARHVSEICILRNWPMYYEGQRRPIAGADGQAEPGNMVVKKKSVLGLSRGQWPLGIRC